MAGGATVGWDGGRLGIWVARADARSSSVGVVDEESCKLAAAWSLHSGAERAKRSACDNPRASVTIASPPPARTTAHLLHHGVSLAPRCAPPKATDIARSIPRSSYYDRNYRQAPALIRARQPYLVKNIVTGAAIFSFAIGVCTSLTPSFDRIC